MRERTSQRVICGLTSAAYAGVALSGLSSFLMGAPIVVVSTMDSHLMVAYWSALLSCGGLVGMIATPLGQHWAERIAVTAVITGLALYAAGLIELHLISPPNRFPHALSLVALMFCFGIRLVRTWPGGVDPEKTARRVNRRVRRREQASH